MLLDRIEHPDGLVYYRSPRLHALGVAHAFSTRLGGVSSAPFDSMNLGNPNGCPVQDDVANIQKNYRRLLTAIGAGGCTLLQVHQVHSDHVVRAESGVTFDRHAKADAIITDDRSTVASVRVADCVPVLLSRDDGQCVAAVHAGWRGVVAGVVPKAAGLLGPAGRIFAAIGPSIGFDAFEVGGEVLDQFAGQFDPAPIRRRADGKGTVDLRQALVQQLVAIGVDQERIDTTDRCTVRDGGEFYSHRRDNGVTGRMAAVIIPAAMQAASIR
ncbi:MAG: peptidoglycan editing factor PgeF [Phycisphaerales bacterium]|nr:peptidoglycan editing factor PgeF [Phycisphaerales bacterium]